MPQMEQEHVSNVVEKTCEGLGLTPERLLEDYYKLKLSRARPSRSSSTRASSIGDPCTARIAWNRVAGEKAQMPDRVLASIYAEGRLQEHGVLMDLQEMGYDVIEAQRTVHWDAYQITGHIDGKLVWNGGKPISFEIKSISPFGFQKIHTAEDVMNHKVWFYQRWAAQIQIYMLLESEETFWLLLKSKTSGELRVIPFYLDLEYAEKYIKKAQVIMDGMEAAKTPEAWNSWLERNRINDIDLCSDCAFKSLCLPIIDGGAGAKAFNDPDMEVALDRRAEIQSDAKEYDELDSEIKEKAKRAFDNGDTTLICGKWLIQGIEGLRKGKKSWTTKISKI